MLKKTRIEKIAEKPNIESELQTILMQYRSMPHSSTGISPAKLVLNRKMKCQLHLIKPVKNQKPNFFENFGKKHTVFVQGEKVFARYYDRKIESIFGRIKQRTGT